MVAGLYYRQEGSKALLVAGQFSSGKMALQLGSNYTGCRGPSENHLVKGNALSLSAWVGRFLKDKQEVGAIRELLLVGDLFEEKTVRKVVCDLPRLERLALRQVVIRQWGIEELRSLSEVRRLFPSALCSKSLEEVEVREGRGLEVLKRARTGEGGESFLDLLSVRKDGVILRRAGACLRGSLAVPQ